MNLIAKQLGLEPVSMLRERRELLSELEPHQLSSPSQQL